MDIQLINKELLKELHNKAVESERLRMNFDQRTTTENGSQRMLNALEPGTHVPIHCYLKTSETVICFGGCLDWVFYEKFSRLANSNERPEVEWPNMDANGPVHDGDPSTGSGSETAVDESCFVKAAKFRVCPREGQYGIRVLLGIWHSIVVHEASTIMEAKDGTYGK